MSQTLSQYANGPYGSIMEMAFYLFGLATLGLALGLLQCMSSSRGAKISYIFLTFFGVSLFFAGAFAADPMGAEYSVSGMVHSLASLFGLTMSILAMILWTRQLKARIEFKQYVQASARLTFLSAVLFVGFLISGGSISGLVQRVFVSSIFVWELHGTRVVLA